jgi:hypothetical protein
MATVLLIDGTDGLPVYVRWPIADEPNVYIRAEILIPSGVLSNWGSFSSTPDMVVLSEGTDPSSFVERVRFFKTGSFHWEDQWAADLTAAVTEETWHTVEVWWDSGLQTGHFAVDGETSSYGATGTSTTFEGAFVGLMNFGIDGQLWVRRIKVGTTDGGAELADYDPDTDGDPAAFGFEVVGAVSLLGSPTPTDPPLIVSATAERALVTLTYDRDLDRTSVPIPGAYAAQVNGDTRAVTRVRVGRRTVRLTLYLGAAPGDTVTVFYEPAGSDPVQGLNGDDAASLSAYPATNLTAVPAHTRADTFGQFPWRSLVCDLAGGQLSLLDGHARDRTITARLNQPWDATGYVYSASRVAQADGPDGDPVLSEGTRLLYVFRQEPDEAGSRWVCRFAGLIDNVDDIAQTEHAVTHYTARDPWQLLYNRPVTNPVNGHFPGADGITYAASPAGYVARSLIETTIATHGSVHLNMDDGTVDAGEDVTITFQQGTSVGEALDQVVATGHIDLRLDPLYDPTQPGICAVFNALAKAGEDRTAQAVFGWGAVPGTMVRIQRTKDGTERANKLIYYYGQGGPPVGVVKDDDSVAKYGEYWRQQFWPGQKEGGPLQEQAAKDLSLYKDGKTLYSFAPFGNIARPFAGWTIGDTVPIYAKSKTFRDRIGPLEGTTGDLLEKLQRILSFTVSMSDDGVETVSELVSVTDEVVNHFEGPLPSPSDEFAPLTSGPGGRYYFFDEGP